MAHIRLATSAFIAASLLCVAAPPCAASAYTLNTTFGGTGYGTMTASGINCPGDCSELVEYGTQMTVTATPSAGSVFVGWGGCDSVAASQCTVTVLGDHAVTASFALLLTFNVVLEGWQQAGPYVVTAASGGGTATYDNIAHTLTLNLTYPGLSGSETMAHIHGPAARGANAPVLIDLAAGSPKTQTVPLATAQEMQLLDGRLYVNIHTSTFPNGEIRGQIDVGGATTLRALTVNKTGSGAVTGTTEAGAVIDCGSDCGENVPHGKAVTLTATPAGGSTFTGWSGACTGTGNCLVTMDAAKTVAATFDVANPPRLGNISTRMQVLTGNDVMIGGFIIGGSLSKKVAIVATGPSLTQYGIANALANPTLTLVRQSDQTAIATNDDWQGAANSPALTAAGLAPSSSLESAILIDLAPGAYTAIVQGAGGGTGVGIVAVYEVDHPEVPLINISARGQVLTGNDVMIGGFIISGATSQTVAIVATGPSLTQYGIANALANPTLTLVRQSDQTVIATNDDWQTDANAAQLTAAGFAPSNPLESAIYITLPPGAYTAILSGAGGGTGIGIIGVYAVD